MREIHTEIAIHAPAHRVWDVLTDFERISEWNPLLREIRGEREAGARWRVRFALSATRAITMRPTVLTYDPPRELRWIGRLGVPGLFDGEHSFRIEAAGEDRVRFVQAERFTGVLVPLMGRLIAKTQRDFEAMNFGLKERAEEA